MNLKNFRVLSYRKIVDSGLIDINQITAFVGQNEAGKSNLFEALYRLNPFDKHAAYKLEEDWPVDNWGAKDPEGKVCEAFFELDVDEIQSLFETVRAVNENVEEESTGGGKRAVKPQPLPEKLTICASGYYDNRTPEITVSEPIDYVTSDVLGDWVMEHMPKFVYISDYEMSGSQMELNQLKERKDTVSWDDLSVDEQTILIVLELAKIDLVDFVSKGSTPEGRTTRSFDKRSASAFLTKQFQDLWQQKKVKFDIEIDATTLNIFAEDELVGMPVRLKRRSTGFRWYVAFAWKFTHASDGEFKNCILLLEEPGIHLHYSAQRDLLKVFERLKDTNTILYTTHLASMVDLGYPERVRIVESRNEHVVSLP